MHESLWDASGEKNLFSDPTDPDGLSTIARHYIGGQIELAPALTAVYAPFINSYKRYVPGVWAPLNATWGVENRTCAIRVITGPGEKAVRAEYRQTAADINPYLALAASIGAGLYGIHHGVEPPKAVRGDATAEGTFGPALPGSLEAATRLLRESDGAREVLGEAFVDHYARTREWEIREHRKAVTSWELARYFEAV
jgi:glutamine synthetase